jgi:regulatory protein
VARVRRVTPDPAAADPDQPDQPDQPDPRDRAADPGAAARQICLQMLTAAPRTRAQLASALARRGVPQDAADAVLDSRHHGRGLSRRALAAELRQRGVPAPEIQSAVGRLDPEQEYATARALVDRRLAATRGLPAPARIRRLTGLLARKGYPAELCYRVVRAALAEQPPDDSLASEAAFEAELALEDGPGYDPADD